MRKNGLEPAFSQEELQQLAQIQLPAPRTPQSIDLTSLLWCSIDNDDSRDLDQLTYAELDATNKMLLWIAIADVDALVHKDSPIDLHAQANTTSVYTPAKVFSMLPERLSTDLTSLAEHADRLALIIKIQINEKGDIEDSSIFQGVVHNYAQLTYSAIGGWLEGSLLLPEKVKRVEGLEKTLKCQHAAAQTLKKMRHELGALTLDPPSVEPKVTNTNEITLPLPAHNYAHQLIEEFMIAANSVMAHHFQEAKLATLNRVVRRPERWERIVEIAAKLGERLPKEPDSKALNTFLIKRKQLDPETFPDLSLAVIKLMGRGEYAVIKSGEPSIGHFGLALLDYTHSTAPNRRFSDLIVQRQYKALLSRASTPYSLEELNWFANHCTQQENAATKVERHLNKSAVAIVLSTQIGSVFNGIITGANEKGTWVRTFQPPAEGKVVKGFDKLDVGDRVAVQLIHVDVEKGFIDFTLHN